MHISLKTGAISRKLPLLICLLAFCLSLASATSAIAEDSLTGVVHNQTTGQPAVGDDVILLRLVGDMPEEARTKTDGQGAFHLSVQATDASHIVRVMHQGVNYDQMVTGAAPLEIKVFDALSKAGGIAGSLGMMRMESDGKSFSVVENYDILNASNPPRTQAGPRNFEFSLPPRARLDAAMVKGPGGIAVKVAPVPAGGQGGYSINFPLRPGDTLYEIRYHLPYQGRVAFQPKLSYPMKRFMVGFPLTMAFTSSHDGIFHPIQDVPNFRIEAAVDLQAGNLPAFEISGAGSLPQEAKLPPAQRPGPAVVAAPPPVPANNSGGSGVRPGTQAGSANSRKPAWVLLAGIFVIVGVGAFLLLRMRAGAAAASPEKGNSGKKSGLEALKEELFQLESERLHGSISSEEYAATKQALNRSMERAMAKNPGRK